MNDGSRQLGRYELLHRIAKGGMGEIFLAKARGAAGFEKNVIIKTILPHLAEEEEFISKFLDEGRIVVQLLHGNIVPVFDMGEQDGEYFIAMEYVPGRDLREVIKRMDTRRETMPVDLALFVGSEIAKGLDYAHRKSDESGKSMGIIHRDVSPSNVLISSEGEVKLIDFGIARAAGRLSKTVSGRIQGKFCYMSPEQASGKAMDARSDVFSAGVTIYEMLTGFRPFEGSTDLESLDLVRRCEFDPPSTLNPEVPEEVDHIVQKALSRDPDERYTSAERLQVEILQYLYSTGTSPTSSDVAKFLRELFPEGLERQELKSARNGVAAPGPMSLDDALDAELDRLMGDATDGIDAHGTTAARSGTSPTPSTKTGVRPPLTADTNPSNAGMPTHPSARLKTDETPRPAEASRVPSTLLVVAVLIVGAAVLWWRMAQPDVGQLTIESDPPGAKVMLDGAELVGVVTPHTLDVKPGVHVITLEHEGHESRTLRVQVLQGESTTLARQDARLEAVLGPRTFTLTAPEGATIFRDQEPMGTSPQSLVLRPNQVANVRADQPGCTSSNYALSYDHNASQVALPLDCPTAEVAVETHKNGTDVGHDSVGLTFDARPTGARVWVDGRELGPTPVTAKFRLDQVIDVRFEQAGFAPYTIKDRVAKWRNRKVVAVMSASEQGCLDISLVNPAVGDVSIDGGAFKSVSRGAKGWPLSVGAHVVRLKNDAAGKDTAFDVDIKPGPACSLIVWE